MPRTLSLLRPLLAVSLLAAAASLLPAGEVRTFTSTDGRTIEAEVLGYKGDTLRIRRVDTNRELKLPLSTLSEEDQRAARKLMRENPGLRDSIRASDIRVEFSRAKFEREKTATAYWRDENVESWGYSVSVLNQTNQPIEGLRLEYVLFALTDPEEIFETSLRKSESERLERTGGREEFEVVPASQRLSVRTKAVVTTKVKYTDGGAIFTAKGKLRSSWRDKELHGVWLRIYDGPTLVHEASSPESLRTAERWSSSQSPGAPPAASSAPAAD
jgi:hypothetical protein